MHASLIASLLLGVAVAACLGGGPAAEPPVVTARAPGFDLPVRDPGAVPIPPQCSQNRTAFAHLGGGEPVAVIGSLPVPCVSKTGAISREPTIGVTQSGAVYHYPAMTGNNAFPNGVAKSTDRGATWDLVLPDLAGQPTHRVSTDPYMFVDPQTDRIFADDLNAVYTSMFSWSDDDGASWQHSYSGGMEADHQTIFTGKPVTSQTIGYANIVYRCAINAVALGGASTMSTCQRSIDGGRTWLPPGEPAFVTDTDALPSVCSGAHGHGTSDLNGTIYLPKGHCGVPMLAISDDEGATWRRAVVADKGIQGHEAGVGVDPAGNIFYTWVADDSLVYLSASRDGGATWSAPVMASAPGVTDAVFPELIVGGVGKIAFVYYGTTNGAETYDAWLAISYDALAERPTFFSAQVNDPFADAFVVGSCCGGVQDFIDVSIGPDGTAWGAFVDDCLGEGRDCEEDPDEVLDTHREGAAGWFWGAPSLWDE